MERVLFAPRELRFLSPHVSEDSGANDAWVRDHEARRSASKSDPACSHALASGGSTFHGPDKLLKGVSSMRIEKTRSMASCRDLLCADANHGEPTEFVRSLRMVLSGA